MKEDALVARLAIPILVIFARWGMFKCALFALRAIALHVERAIWFPF